MNADGSVVTRLTNSSLFDGAPAWSPDGTKIAFASNRDGSTQIYVMNADGSLQTRLSNNSATESTPAWSPNGDKLAFTTNKDGNVEVYVMNANGSGQVRLTSNAATDTQPAWSPDGTKIAFTSNRDGNNEIYVMNADGSAQTRLTNIASNDANPDWQRTPPGPPTGVSAVAGNGQAVVAFTPPTSAGGTPITSYTVTAFPGAIQAAGTQSPITVGGLTNGTSYTFTVTATNAAGTGAASAPSAAVTPATVPGAPMLVNATAGVGQAIVDFNPPPNGGAAITLYTVVASPGGITATGSARPVTVTGLTNGTAYSFTVTAKNSVGTWSGLRSVARSHTVRPSDGALCGRSPARDAARHDARAARRHHADSGPGGERGARAAGHDAPGVAEAARRPDEHLAAERRKRAHGRGLRPLPVPRVPDAPLLRSQRRGARVRRLTTRRRPRRCGRHCAAPGNAAGVSGRSLVRCASAGSATPPSPSWASPRSSSIRSTRPSSRVGAASRTHRSRAPTPTSCS